MEATMTETSSSLIHHRYSNELKSMFLLLSSMLLVFVTLPVTIMGDKNFFEYFSTANIIHNIHIDKDCLTSSKCSLNLPNESVMTIDMSPIVSSTLPFEFTAQFSSMNVELVTVNFQGVEHTHGRQQIIPLNQYSDNAFKVSGLLGYCGYGTMEWLAKISVQSGRYIFNINVPFQSVDPK